MNNFKDIKRVRGTGTLVHNIELLCHGKLERYQPLTFIKRVRGQVPEPSILN